MLPLQLVQSTGADLLCSGLPGANVCRSNGGELCAIAVCTVFAMCAGCNGCSVYASHGSGVHADVCVLPGSANDDSSPANVLPGPDGQCLLPDQCLLRRTELRLCR
jgi:hypothetical protein